MSFQYQTVADTNVVLINPGRKKTVMLLHGYGANAEDLASLAAVMEVGDVTWVFPEAPIKLDFFPGLASFTWFPLDENRLRELKNRPIEQTDNFKPEGLQEAALRVQSVVEALTLDPAQTAIGGFSQGAMVANHVALNSKQSYAGLLSMSGTLICRQNWVEGAAAHKSTKFFISHGHFDERLPVEKSRNFGGILKAAGLQGEEHYFGGGHEIPYEVVAALKSFLLKAFQ
jgi:phospholipase/carboxylesterase